MPDDLLIARNPEPDSTLPYLVRIPLGPGGIVVKAKRARVGRSRPFGYGPRGQPAFPKHCCTSVNEVVCHGIPAPKHLLREGDIINVDVTPVLDEVLPAGG